MSHSWLAAPLSLDDYQAAILIELEFLRTVCGFPHLTVPGQSLKNAIRRYETCWLPLLLAAEASGNERLVPPIDVHWVWHCHMLSPVSYRNDCLKLVGKVLDHCVSQATPDELSYSLKKWREEIRGEDYEIPVGSEHQPGRPYTQKSSYDLTAACLRQASFYYNVSLPHYKDIGFIDHAVLRYKKFLYLRKIHPEQFIVPSYDIDLVWHTHQLHPLAYIADMTLYLGSLFSHDDTDTDRSPTSKLTVSGKDTRKLWRAEFGEEFVLTGAMYRGPPPAGRLATMHADQVSALRQREGSVHFQLITLENSSLRQPRLAVSANRRRIASLSQHTAKLVNPPSVLWCGTPVCFVRFCSTFDERLLCKIKPDATCQCFSFSNTKYYGIFPLAEFLPDGRAWVGRRSRFCVTQSIGSTTMRLEGYTLIEKLSNNALLRVELSQFRNVTMDDPLELIWGPMSVGVLPPGASKLCLVATHRLFASNLPKSSSLKLSVRILHCLPLVMSAVQVLVGDEIVALAHLVSADQVPDVSLLAINSRSQCISIDCRAGERALVIKNSRGDWGFVFGRWANMRQGEPGNPGNLQVRFVKLGEPLITHTVEITREENFAFDIPGTKGNLSSDQMLLDHHETAERVALAFSIAVLNVLCQPPPAGYSPPLSHGKPGPVNAPTAMLPLVAAAGWLMPTPSNGYIATQKSWFQQEDQPRHAVKTCDAKKANDGDADGGGGGDGGGKGGTSDNDRHHTGTAECSVHEICTTDGCVDLCTGNAVVGRDATAGGDGGFSSNHGGDSYFCRFGDAYDGVGRSCDGGRGDFGGFGGGYGGGRGDIGGAGGGCFGGGCGGGCDSGGCGGYLD